MVERNPGFTSPFRDFSESPVKRALARVQATRLKAMINAARNSVPSSPYTASIMGNPIKPALGMAESMAATGR